MTALPSALALAEMPDGSLIVAADHRNNYAAIQAAQNAILTALGAGVAGQVLGLTPGATAPVYPPGYEFGYDQMTGTVVVTSSTESAGTTIIAGSAHVFDGAPVIATFFAPLIEAPTTVVALTISLFESATQIGRLVEIEASGAANPTMFTSVTPQLRFTPSAGSHTYSVTASASAATSAVIGGAGGTATLIPGFLRFTKV